MNPASLPGEGAPPQQPVLDLAEVLRDRGREPDFFRLEVERFAILPGERIAVVGPSGSGKSTFLDLLSLTLAPSLSARFLFGPRQADIAALWRKGESAALARLRAGAIGYVLQSGALLPFLSARENIELPLRLAGRVGEAERLRLGMLLARLGLQDCARRRPAELSIGQRQRVAVARALAHRPKLILADEPTASLDAVAAASVMALLVELAAETVAAVVLVTHDETLALKHGFSVIACRPLGGAGGRARGAIRRER